MKKKININKKKKIIFNNIIIFKNKFLKILSKFRKIVIYRHKNPDIDSLSSQFGLFFWLKKNFINKKIYIAGKKNVFFDNNFLKKKKYLIEKKNLKNFLGIIVDTSKKKLIDGKIYKNAEFLINIDHHIDKEFFGNFFLNFPVKSSCSELISDLFFLCNDKKIDKNISFLLLAGILSDTLNFSIKNINFKTFLIVSKLIKNGADISKINYLLYNKKYEFFKNFYFISKKIIFYNSTAFFILKKKDLKKMNISFNEGKDYLDIMSKIKEFKIWAIFIEKKKNTFSGSIRSKDKSIIEICKKFNGGGHPCACGIQKISFCKIKLLIKKLYTLY